MRGFTLTLFLLTFLAQQERQASGYRILGLVPIHGKSHFVVMHELLKGLAEHGHQVDVISHFPMKKPIPNYRDISLEGTMPAAVNNMSFENMAHIRGSMQIRKMLEVVGSPLCDLMALPQFQNIIKNPPNDPPYDLVVAELFVSPCFLAFAHHLKVPLVGATTCYFHDWLNHPAGNPLNTAYMPSLFSTYTQNMTFWERLVNTVQTNVVINQMNYYMSEQNEQVRKYFGPGMPDVLEMQKDVALFLSNSHYSLNGIRPWTPAVVEYGGLHIGRNDDIPLSAELKKFLDESTHGFVYFTFGSMARIETFPNETVKAFFESFKNIAPVRVLMKVAKKEDLMPGLPKNVMIQSWFPQVTILKHKNIRAFLTHGGLMGTMEAVAHGVPMVGIPLFGDQHINMQNYMNKKVAISLGSYEHVTTESLTNALNSVLKDPSYKENARRLSKLFLDRPMSPMDTAIYWIEYVARHGNILRSPVVDLAWWQSTLLDVYGTIGLVLLLVLYILLLLVRGLKRIFFGSRTCSTKSAASTKDKKNK